jgi:hypothetical protein
MLNRDSKIRNSKKIEEDAFLAALKGGGYE